MTINVRPARPEDAPQMVDLLNRIIEIGGTTAHQTPMTVERMMDHYLAPKLLISCVVAVKGADLLGFQSLEWSDHNPSDPHSRPADWAYIASFVKDGQQGKGIGSQLFKATSAAAKAKGVTAINATIRADNPSGLAFYGRMGFREEDRIVAVPLTDGTPVDRIRKTYHIF